MSIRVLKPIMKSTKQMRRRLENRIEGKIFKEGHTCKEKPKILQNR